MGPTLSLGRIVLYTSLGDADGWYPAEPHPALIVGLHADNVGDGVPLVDLTVFYKTGIFNMARVPFAEEAKRGHWSWPRLK